MLEQTAIDRSKLSVDQYKRILTLLRHVAQLRKDEIEAIYHADECLQGHYIYDVIIKYRDTLDHSDATAKLQTLKLYLLQNSKLFWVINIVYLPDKY